MVSKQRGGITATPRLGMKRGSPTNGDLSHTLQLLDEDTMSQACTLLLSQRDYDISDDAAVKVHVDKAGKETSTTNGESDYDKLLAIYTKCRDAALKVEQQMPVMSIPNLSTPVPPSTSSTTPSARAAAKKAHILNAMSPPRRMSVKQKMGRAANIKVGAGGLDMISKAGAVSRTGKTVVGGPNMIRPTSLKREPSDTSIASSTSVLNRVSANKKARLSSGSASSTATATSPEGNKAAAPPPAALDFLQALNNQQNEKEEQKDPVPKVDDDDDIIPSSGRASRSRAAKNSVPAVKTETKGKRSSPRTRL